MIQVTGDKIQLFMLRLRCDDTGAEKLGNLCQLFCFFQAPTERQLRYKEKVAELRKKRNSGLSKEQKEKYMV